MAEFGLFDLGRHGGFILASYVAAIVVLGGLVLRALLLHRRAVAALKALSMSDGGAP